jgi:hypothetical protein
VFEDVRIVGVDQWVATSFSSTALVAARMLVMCVTSNMKGWCQKLMRSLSGPSCRGMHLLGFATS